MRGGFRPAFFEKNMLKIKLSFFSFLITIFLFTNCIGFKKLETGGQETVAASVQETQSNRHWICGVQDGQLIIIGVSSRLTRQNDEIEAAKQDAASKAAMYHGIQGSVTSFNRTTANIMEYASDSVISLNYDTDLTRYLDRLSFDPGNDVIRTSGIPGYPTAVFVRMKYNEPAPVNVNYNSVISGGSPTWINGRDLPEISGYTAAIGVSGRKAQLKDAIASSMHAAAARLIEIGSTQMETVDRTGTGISSSSATYSRSEGRLSNFIVLELWIADNGSVYALAIARVAQ